MVEVNERIAYTYELRGEQMNKILLEINKIMIDCV